jgi:hypothetical protein
VLDPAWRPMGGKILRESACLQNCWATTSRKTPTFTESPKCELSSSIPDLPVGLDSVTPTHESVENSGIERRPTSEVAHALARHRRGEAERAAMVRQRWAVNVTASPVLVT